MCTYHLFMDSRVTIRLYVYHTPTLFFVFYSFFFLRMSMRYNLNIFFLLNSDKHENLDWTYKITKIKKKIWEDNEIFLLIIFVWDIIQR